MLLFISAKTWRDFVAVETGENKISAKTWRDFVAVETGENKIR